MAEKYSKEVYRKAILKWKSLHPDKKYLDIKKHDKIELKEIGLINIGIKITNLRQLYKKQQEGKNMDGSKALTKEEIDWYNNQGMIWDYEAWQENNFQQAILKWKEKHPEKMYLDIKKLEKISLEGVGIINLGIQVSIRRSIYNAMQKGEQYLNCRNLTEEEIIWYTKQGMIWDYEAWQEEVYKQAILKWKEEHPDKNNLDIKKNEKINLEGIGQVKIGIKIANIRQIYKKQQEGKGTTSKKPLTKKQIAWYTEHGMIWDYKKYQEEHKGTSQKRQTSLEKYTELFNGDNKKAERVVACLEDLREKRKRRKKQNLNMDNILQEFNVDQEELLKQLGRTRTQEKENQPVLMKGEETLRKFCIDNGYNYEIISRSVKLHRMLPSSNLEEVMNRAIIDYNYREQKQPSTWIYEKYGNLIKHILTNLNLDSSAILKNMTDNVVTLEEAIRHDVFLRCRKESSNAWLEEPYNYLVEELDNTKGEEQVTEDIVSTGKKLIDDYHLSREEFSILVESFGRYANAIRGYQMYDVGLETKEERRIEKIKAYQMPEEDIEESFFIPLNFENGVLLGRQSELYQRRNLMRQYIIDWNEYSDDEKIEVIKTNHFNAAEVEYMERTRKEIDKAIIYSKK